MLAATTPAVRDTRRTWVRALTVAGGAAAAAIAWSIEVPLLGVRLSVRFGPMHPQAIVAGQVIGAALVAGLLGWLLLTVLERGNPRARAIWTGTALAVVVLSLGLPAATATTTAAAVALVVLHLVVAAAVIPALAASSRRHTR